MFFLFLIFLMDVNVNGFLEEISLNLINRQPIG